MEGKIPVLDSFTVTTPSLSVVIRADDTPLPSNVQQQGNPANLVTVHAVECKNSSSSASSEATAREDEEEEKAAAAVFASEQQQMMQQRQQQQQRLMHLNSLSTLSQDELKELKELQERELYMQAIDREIQEEETNYSNMLKRAESKHADEVYRQFGAPPPIKPLEEVVTETDADGFIKRISTFETKDFTYWDRLRRHNTQTVIRRWKSYIPAGEEDTAFFARNIQANVPGDAYTQGIYYKQLQTFMKPKEYKLPTDSYVAPPVYVRRTNNYEKRIYDPILSMNRRLHACTTNICCPPGY